ncbi:viral movement protein [Medicago truncatula]|uniref:Viral movement protein n=1 Tax=Medicago truncatula TaxID=3880 RepID=G7IU00_MEDTR|nr:viral movement protein [Medicago truncatula]
MTEVSYFEGTSSYYADDIIDNKIEESDLSLTAEENFKRKFNKFKEFFSRKNILKFGIMIEEEAISIENTQGNIFISTIQKTQIEKRIETFSEKEKSKSGYIHISTIQILIKSTFMKGIDSPLEIALEDSRILDKRQATIAQVKCNLKYEKIKFDINLQMGLSLKDKDLDRSIVFHYKLENSNFMKKGNHPFTICYRINYSLSNSHHSIEFIGKNTIHIDELFTPLVTLRSPIFRNLARNSFSLIEAEKYIFEETEKPSIRD